MKKIYNFFKKRSWVFILIACVMFIPQSFSYQAKLNMRVLVTGLAIDKADKGYEVTAQIVMPSAGSESAGLGARLDFISEKGDSVAEGIQKIAYKIGKTAALSHISFVMVGQNMLEDNLVTALDFFARDAQVAPAITMLVCDGEAKQTLKETKNLELSVGLGLQKVFIYKQSSLNGFVMTLDEFINNAFSLAKSSIVGGVIIAPEGQEESGNNGKEEASSAENNQSSNSSGGGAEEKNARIKFYNDVYYFKNGKFVNKLTKEEDILGVYLMEKFSNGGDFKITGISGELLNDATVGLQLNNKRTSFKIEFKDGKPVCKVKVNIKDVQITEILNNDRPSINIYKSQDKRILSAIEEGLKQRIEVCITSAFEKAKQDGVDIFDIGERAYQTKTKEWKKYYNENGENYLKNINIEIEVEVKNIN